MIELKPIGQVIIENNCYYLQIDKDYFRAVKGLDEYTHLQVLWYFSLHDTPEKRSMRITEKPYVNGPDIVGLFATRSPIRPNPIAITPCELLGIDELTRRIQVNFIDAEHQTPILDIKPYETCMDRVESARPPKWASHWPKSYEESAGFDWSKEFNF